MATKLQSPTPSKGVQFQLNANTFLRTGYTFNGWSTNYASSTSEFADNAYVTFDGDRDLYALWKANNYQVRFNANGGTGSMGNQTFTYDQGQYLAANAFGRTGYDFNRWTANADGSGNQYGNGVWVSNLTATPGGIVDLYAQWAVKQYTATFYYNDGTGGYTQKTQDYGSSLSAPSIARAGYQLSGWSPSVPGTMPANDSSYTAQWTLSQMQYTDTVKFEFVPAMDFNEYLAGESSAPSRCGAGLNVYLMKSGESNFTKVVSYVDQDWSTTYYPTVYGNYAGGNTYQIRWAVENNEHIVQNVPHSISNSVWNLNWNQPRALGEIAIGSYQSNGIWYRTYLDNNVSYDIPYQTILWHDKVPDTYYNCIMRPKLYYSAIRTCYVNNDFWMPAQNQVIANLTNGTISDVSVSPSNPSTSESNRWSVTTPSSTQLNITGIGYLWGYAPVSVTFKVTYLA